MSEAEIESKLESLENKLDILLNRISVSDRTYNIEQFVRELGISRYRLKQLWSMYRKQMPISQPKRCVKYTQKDVIAIKEFLNERRIAW